MTSQDIFREFAELEKEFKGDKGPYARGYRAALRQARNIIRQMENNQND